MKGSLDAAFKRELKALILDACDQDGAPEVLPDDAPLLGEESVLALDSIDGLQITVAIQKRYGHRITDPKEARVILASINSLADYLRPA